jgi:hypothetical protein
MIHYSESGFRELRQTKTLGPATSQALPPYNIRHSLFNSSASAIPSLGLQNPNPVDRNQCMFSNQEIGNNTIPKLAIFDSSANLTTVGQRTDEIDDQLRAC